MSGGNVNWIFISPKMGGIPANVQTFYVKSGHSPIGHMGIAQSVEVPFEGRDCVSIDISAWREGPYDGNPFNSRQPELTRASRSTPKPAVPAECNNPEYLVHLSVRTCRLAASPLTWGSTYGDENLPK
jgi:hypothetical protein